MFERAREEDVAVLDVNDNYGDWNASRTTWSSVRSTRRPPAPLRRLRPGDAVASIHPHLGEAALEMMRVNVDAETPASSGCRLGASG